MRLDEDAIAHSLQTILELLNYCERHHYRLVKGHFLQDDLLISVHLVGHFLRRAVRREVF